MEARPAYAFVEYESPAGCASTVCGFAHSLLRVVGARRAARLFQRLTVTEMVTGVAWRYVWATVHCFSM